MDLISTTQETELQRAEEKVGLGYCLVALGQEKRAGQILASPQDPSLRRLAPTAFTQSPFREQQRVALSRTQWLVIHSDSPWPGLPGLWASPGAHPASPGVGLLCIPCRSPEAPNRARRLLEQPLQPHWLLISRSDASFPLFPFKVPSLRPSEQQGRTFDKSANLRSFVRLRYC